MKSIIFHLVYQFLKIVALLPFRLIYRLSSGIYILTYHIIGYRKRVVLENLRNAFPEKGEPEVREIAKGFYHHFCDYMFESIKILKISQKEINERFRFKDIDLFDRIFNSGKSIVLVSGHQGNWEWMIDIQSKIRHKFLAIYKPLADPIFDSLLKKLRLKYANGGELVAMNDIYKSLIRQKQQGTQTATWFLADQSPPKDYPFWIDFMNRETPFFTGPARIAKKFGHPVVFMQIKKLYRGYYEAEFSVLEENPENSTEEELAKKYVRKIEEGIREQPEYWLWSHRRWKHQKEKQV